MAEISKETKDWLLGLTDKDITFNFLKEHFMDTFNRKEMKRVSSKLNSNDTFWLEAGEFHNKKRVKTSVGLYIYNLYLFVDFWHFMEYQEDIVSDKQVKKTEKLISNALLTDVIAPAQMGKYLNRIQWFSMQLHSIVSGSFTMNTLKPNKVVMKERDRLLKENKEDLENGDVIKAVKIEKQLLDTAKKELAGDSGMNLYDSGARGSFGNNFKNISVMKGPVVNPITGQFDVVTTNFMEGIQKKDIHVMGNSVVSGAYPKAVGTAVAGYFSKKIIAAMQSVVLDKKGSDCKTVNGLRTSIHPNQINDYLYRYVIDGGKLTLLTPENINNYTNKPIKLRSVMYCAGDKVCNKCGGELNYMLGVTNLGLTASRASSTVLNMGMKKFHNSSRTVISVDPKRLTI